MISTIFFSCELEKNPDWQQKAKIKHLNLTRKACQF